jgi:SNF2 family DNA or RNA helicase
LRVWNQGYDILSLSATIADNPLQMRAIGYVLGLFPSLQSYWSWAFKNGCYKETIRVKKGMGTRGSNFREVVLFDEENPSYLKNIHASIFPSKGSRIRISELGDAFPETQILAECYTMDNSAKIQKIYDEMEAELQDLAVKYSKDKRDEDGKVNHLTIQLRARQKVELLKVPSFVEQAQDAIEAGHSVAIFVNFSESLKKIAEKLKTSCIIDGSQTQKTRDKNIAQFQSDEERVIVCNIRAGGVGVSLHDLNGKYSRMSLISPPYSAQDLKQALGRVHRDGGKTKSLQRIIFTAKTIEEEIAKVVKKKLDRISLLNDGDLSTGLNI